MTDLILSQDFTPVYSLKKYLQVEIPATQILHGWPEPDKDQVLPVISINQMGDSNTRNHNPRFKSQEAIDGDDINVKALYKTGAIEMVITADIWASTKSGVGQAYKEFKNAINKAQKTNIDNPKGLELELLGYYGELARYDIVRYNYIEGEAESQRREHRIKVQLTCNFDEITEVTMPKIVESEISGEISDNVDLGE